MENNIKLQYINNLQSSDSVKEGYKMIFKKIAPLEEEFGKDLKDFNKDELLKTLDTLKGRSYNSVHTKWGFVKKYTSHFNNMHIKEITSDDLKKRIIEVETRYITRKKLLEKVSVLPSATHKALLLLLFDGVGGRGYSEICNLKYSDIDFKTRKVTLENRELTLSKETIDFLSEAMHEDQVCKLNATESLDSYYPVNPSSPYVFKTRIIASTNNGLNPYKLTGLQRRLDILTKLLDMNNMNGKTLYYSGLAEKYLKLEKKFGRHFSVQDISMFSSVVDADTIQDNTMYRAIQLLRSQYNYN